MFIPSLPVLIATRFLAGGAGAVIVAMALILIGDHYTGRPRERRIGISHALGAFLIGLVLQVAGLLANVNWRYAFLVHLTAVPMLLFALMSKDLAVSGELKGADQDRSKREPFPPVVWAIGLLTLGAGAIAYSWSMFTPFHLKNIGAYTPSTASLLIVITVFASVITSLLYGEIRRFLSSSMVFAVALLGWGAGFAATAMTDDLHVIYACMCFVGLAGGLVGPNIFSVVSSVTNDAVRPRAVGVVKGIYYFGPFFGPTVLKALGLQKEPETALMSLAIFSGCLGVICLVGAVFLRGRDPGDPKTELNEALEAELEADKA
jgi:MFS family permease